MRDNVDDIRSRPRIVDKKCFPAPLAGSSQNSDVGSTPFRGFVQNNIFDLDVELRKRQFELEIEEGRARLRLVEAKRERLELNTSRWNST